jgi:phage baseplate assembly protein W
MDKFSKNIAFLGRGWAFPPSFSLNSADGVAMVDGNPVKNTDGHNVIPIIERSLNVIIHTFRGTRVVQPTFGCNLTPFLFENVNLHNTELIKKFIQEAVTEHEPRVVIETIEIKTGYSGHNPQPNDFGTLLISVEYYVISTNNRYNYVFPFYQKEATNREI